MGLAIVGAIALQGSSLITPYFGLDVHSFILATLGVLAGFQLVIFGIAAALYGVQAGAKAETWLVMISSLRVRMSAAGVGLLLAVGGLLVTTAISVQWLGHRRPRSLPVRGSCVGSHRDGGLAIGFRGALYLDFRGADQVVRRHPGHECGAGAGGAGPLGGRLSQCE